MFELLNWIYKGQCLPRTEDIALGKHILRCFSNALIVLDSGTLVNMTASVSGDNHLWGNGCFWGLYVVLKSHFIITQHISEKTAQNRTIHYITANMSSVIRCNYL